MGCLLKSYKGLVQKRKANNTTRSGILWTSVYPRLELFPEDDLNSWWLWLGVIELGMAAELNIMFDACADGWVWLAESGERGPNESICGCLCKNGIWGCPCPCMILVDEAGLVASAVEPGLPTGLGLMFTGLDATVLLPPLGLGSLVPVWFKRPDITCMRPAEILCLALSTCSHSFKSKVSTSANCFSFNSNLFSCKFSNCR
jgi:hypothetical protein